MDGLLEETEERRKMDSVKRCGPIGSLTLETANRLLWT